MKKIFRQAFIALAIAVIIAVCAGIDAPTASSSAGKDIFSSPASGTVGTRAETEDAVAVFDPFDDSEFLFVPEEGTTYIIRETNDGKIGVFREGESSPSALVDIYVFTLPEGVASLLREGFECDSETLSGLIDTFTS